MTQAETILAIRNHLVPQAGQTDQHPGQEAALFQGGKIDWQS